MKTMKKLVAALLVLTMVLALTGTAMAACKFKAGTFVKFTKNTVVYNCKDGKATKAWVRKGSTAEVAADECDGWVKLFIAEGDKTATRWFKTGNMKAWDGDTVCVDGKKVKLPPVTHIVYCQGGVGMSKTVVVEDVDAGFKSCYKHVKATKGSVWMHKHAYLKDNLGLALSKGKKATFLNKYGMDERFQMFWKIKYKGKCGYVSAAYTEVVK